MAVPERQRWPSVDPRYRLLRTDDSSLTLEDVASGDTFHSGCGAASECHHVYLQNSGVAEQLAQPIRVLEIGFGTGLAFLITAEAALRQRASLLYTALESDPLSRECLRQVLDFPPPWESRLGPVRDRFLAAIDSEWPSQDRDRASSPQHIYEIQRGIELRLVVADAGGWAAAQVGSDDPDAELFHAIYFDPFSPASAPALWSKGVMRGMYARLRGGGKLVSYCVNSQVRRRLAEAGFAVHRVPGPPGGKREVLVAEKPPR